MKTREEILSDLQKCKPDLVKRFGLQQLALFNTFARGDNQEGSDVDILVEVPPTIGLELVNLAEEIETILGMPADVVSRRAIKPRYWNIIQEELIDVT